VYFDNSSNGVFPSDYINYDTIVFNLTLNGFTGAQAELRSIFLTIPADYSGNIIINVLPGAGVSKLLINAGAVYINGKSANPTVWSLAREFSDRIIWNFPDDTLSLIESGNHVIIGSVLAPYSDYKTVYINGVGGSVNGTLVARSVNATSTSGWETHSTTYFGRNLPDDRVSPTSLVFRNVYSVPVTPPVTYRFEFMKIDSGDGTGIPGVMFALYESLDDLESGTNTVATAISSSVSGSVGQVRFTGLTSEGPYYMIETAPAAGYIANDTIYMIEFTGQTAFTISVYDEDDPEPLIPDGYGVYTIENKKEQVNDEVFPESGGNGVLWFTVAGLLVMAGAVILLPVYRRGKKTTQVR